MLYIIFRKTRPQFLYKTFYFCTFWANLGTIPCFRFLFSSFYFGTNFFILKISIIISFHIILIEISRLGWIVFRELDDFRPFPSHRLYFAYLLIWQFYPWGRVFFRFRNPRHSENAIISSAYRKKSTEIYSAWGVQKIEVLENHF